jgi:hypothetical protein
MPDASKYHLDFSPKSYWDVPEERQARIKGASRRRVVEQAIKKGRYDEIPPQLLGESLSRELSQLLGSMDLQNMGGEYLPPLRTHEIEIARVVFDSTSADVTSFRARKSGGRIHYSVTDEYENLWSETKPRTSTKPISLRKLIDMINQATYEDDDSIDRTCGVFDKWLMPLYQGEAEPDDFLDSFHVSSPYYPEITRWFRDSLRERLDDWSSDSKDQSQDDES